MKRVSAVLVAVALAAGTTVTVARVVSQAPAPASPAAGAGPVPDLARLPLLFVANEGRWDGRAAWVAVGSEASAFFVDGGVRWALSEGWALDQVLVGARSAAPVASVAATATVSYFTGDRHHAGLPTAAELRLGQAWPGVDAVWSGRGGHVEATYRVAPGADPAQVRVAWKGADGLAVTPTGRLTVRTPVRTFEEDVPVAWQDIAGRRVPVDVSYDVAADGSYGFRLGAYDPAHELVIDPVTLVVAGFLGGSGDEDGEGVAVDSAGNAYVTGATRSTSTTFPETPGAYQNQLIGPFGDAFVAKFSPDGSTLLYATYLGGGQLAFGVGITVDGSGNAYVTGHTNTGFPVTPGAFQTTFGGGTGSGGGLDAFVTKLNATGTALVYSTYLGGNGNETGQDIKVDASGNAWVYANGDSTDFPTTPGAFQTTAGGDVDVTVTRLNATGTALISSTYFGGADAEVTGGMEVDAAGNVYLSGSTRSTAATFPETVGAFQTQFGGGIFDAFVAKLNPTLTGVVYATYLGGSGDDLGAGMAVDGLGNAYLTGETGAGGVFPTTPGAFSTVNAGAFDVFVTKLNPTGSGLVYSTLIGSAFNSHRGRDLVVDAFGTAWVTGLTQFFSGYPVTPDAFQPEFGGGFQDAFVTRVNATGSALLYSSFLGGPGDEGGFGLAVDGEGDVFVVGTTTSSGAAFPVTEGAFQTDNGGGGDAFLVKLARVRPAVTTQASAGVPIGGAVRDVATLTGGQSPTGTVTFRLYSDAGCDVEVFTSTVPVTAQATATSAWYLPTALGTYYWSADYSGDTEHKPSSSPCGAPNESVVVRPFEPPPCTQTITGDYVGPLTVGAGQSVCVTNARVYGPITVNPGGAFTVTASKLARGVTADGPAFFSLCGTEVAPTPVGGLAVRVANAPVPVRLGDPTAGCAGNTLGGSAEITANVAVIFRSNTLGRGATITGNGPGNTLVAANWLYGSLACSGNSPAPTNAGQVNTATSKTGQCTGL